MSFCYGIKRCELLVLNNNNAGRIKEDVITLCKRLEKFIKLIKQKNTNNSSDKSYSAYNNSVKQKSLAAKKFLIEFTPRYMVTILCLAMNSSQIFYLLLKYKPR